MNQEPSKQDDGPHYKNYAWGLETTMYHRIGLRMSGTQESIAEWDAESEVIRFRPAVVPASGTDDLAYLIKGLQDFYNLITFIKPMSKHAVSRVVSVENEQIRKDWHAKRQARQESAASQPAKKKAKAKRVRKKTRQRKAKKSGGAKK